MFYKVVGRSTELLSCLFKNDWTLWDHLAGHFQLPSILTEPILSGRVGIAPLVYLAKVLTANEVKVKVLMGASTAGFLSGKDMFDRLGVDYLVSTDDGSEGMREGLPIFLNNNSRLPTVITFMPVGQNQCLRG